MYVYRCSVVLHNGISCGYVTKETKSISPHKDKISNHRIYFIDSLSYSVSNCLVYKPVIAAISPSFKLHHDRRCNNAPQRDITIFTFSFFLSGAVKARLKPLIMGVAMRGGNVDNIVGAAR